MPHPPLYTIKKHDHFPAEDVAIMVKRQEDQEPLELHTHEFNELTVILSGHGNHLTEMGEYALSGGDAFHVAGHRFHGFRDTDQLSLINILYDPRIVMIPASALANLPGYHALMMLEPHYRDQHEFSSRLRLDQGQLDLLDHLCNRIEQEIEKQQPGYEFMVNTYFLEVIGHLSRCFTQAVDPDSRFLLRLGEAIAYMDRHFCDPLEIAALAKIAHLSPRQFQRIFMKSQGISPINYLMRLRIKRAMELITDLSLNIAEVAQASGFEDANYFSRFFRRYVGVSPRQFRKQHAAISTPRLGDDY